MPAGTTPAFPFHVHLGPNVNFFVRPGSDWSGGSGASIDALNDALNVRLPMFIGGNPTVFNGGNVGIGTVQPDRDLQIVNGASSARGVEVATASGSARKEVLLSIDGNYAYLDSYNLAAGGHPLKIQVNGGNTLLNPAGGNVGIGTSSPNAKLEVWGNARFGTDFTTMPAPTYGGVLIGQYGGGATGELQFLSAAGANGYGYRLHGLGDGSFRIDRRANSTSWSDFIIFTTSGYVGIGTMSPTSSLTVAGVIESSSNGFKFPDGTVQTTAYPTSTFSSSGGNIGIGTSPSNRLHVYAPASMDGIAVDGASNPAINFRNNGVVNGYIGLATASGVFSTDARPNDLVIRSESNNILLGRGSNRATLAIVGGNVGVGLTDMTTYINTDATWFRPAAAGTHVASYSATSEAVFNAMSNQDVNGAHIGGLYFTRVGGQSDAHYQIAAIQARQSGTGTLAGGDLWFFTKPTGGGGGADNARMVIRQNGHIVIGDPTTTDNAILNVAGDINVTGNINAKYQDVAEWVSSGIDLDAATVVVLDPSHDDQVMPSSRAYDTSVAGVVSSTPGVILGVGGEGKEKIATTGRVKVKVDATRAPIAIGDLLVTSDVPGTAMKSEPIEINGRKFHQPGTVIGKALQPLSGGRGEILVLLSLQ
jgi:hypothetical protein